MDRYWLSDPNFIKLCDFVAMGELICLTGSGISKGLRLKNGTGAPDWFRLLQAIRAQLEDRLTDNERLDLDILLTKHSPGEHMIEASSILYHLDPEAFMQALADSVDLEKDATSPVHRRLLELAPKGILTYNYDAAHENAIAQDTRCGKWETVLPSDNERIVRILKQTLGAHFLFKMHGTADQRSSLVLTRESYRDLFTRYPYYKPFLQQIFTNHHLLIVGFGMSDPDFETLLRDVFSTFGSPIQEHIVFKHIKTKSPQDTLYRLRYGLNFLYVEDFSHIPRILADCIRTPGTLLQEILEKSVSPALAHRGEAHSKTRQLSPIGKRCLADLLEERIRGNIAREHTPGYDRDFENSEYIFTYGVIADSTDDPAYRDFLIREVIEKSTHGESVAHGLMHLRDVLKKEDFPIVAHWLEYFRTPRFRNDPNHRESPARVYKYCESIYYLMKAKYDIP